MADFVLANGLAGAMTWDVNRDCRYFIIVMMMMMMMMALFSYHGAYLKTIEDNNSKLEDILDSVHLGYYWYYGQK